MQFQDIYTLCTHKVSYVHLYVHIYMYTMLTKNISVKFELFPRGLYSHADLKKSL